MEVGQPTHFTVFTKGSGKAKLDVHFVGATKGEVVRDFEIIDNHDYSYTVKYTAVQQVRWLCGCPGPLPMLAGRQIPRSLGKGALVIEPLLGTHKVSGSIPGTFNERCSTGR